MSLHRGDRFTLAGRRYRVVMVNDSRAHCVATVREPVTRRDLSGRARTFKAKRQYAIDISPDTPLELLAEDGER